MKTKRTFILLVLALLVTAFLAVRYGSAELDWQTFFASLAKEESVRTESVILYSVRIPRLLAGLLAGAGLAVSGVLLQAVTDNPLAAPNIIGVNAGAGFGVVLCLSFLETQSALRHILLPAAAFLGAFLTTLLITALAGKRSRSSLILAGVAVTALLNAGISAFTYADTDLLALYNAFSVGGLGGVKPEQLLLPGAMIALCFLCAMLFSRQIDLFCLGDSGAAALGVPVGTVRLTAVLCASASAAAAVSFAGLLGFVGLIVPHIARRLVGYRSAHLLPASAVLGAAVTVLADLGGRVLAAPTEIPVGIMMAFAGAPFFLILLLRQRNGG
ncbi:MAG: iron ABC transporter permease [Clostridia bacterium]|nr:iron ABC transporter permease [Clostridia bacterium]